MDKVSATDWFHPILKEEDKNELNLSQSGRTFPVLSEY